MTRLRSLSGGGRVLCSSAIQRRASNGSAISMAMRAASARFGNLAPVDFRSRRRPVHGLLAGAGAAGVVLIGCLLRTDPQRSSSLWTQLLPVRGLERIRAGPHRQAPARHLLTRPAATGAAGADKYHQRNPWQSQQLLVNIQVGQFQFLHYTAATAVNWTVLGVRVHGSFFTSP